MFTSQIAFLHLKFIHKHLEFPKQQSAFKYTPRDFQLDQRKSSPMSTSQK